MTRKGDFPDALPFQKRSKLLWKAGAMDDYIRGDKLKIPDFLLLKHKRDEKLQELLCITNLGKELPNPEIQALLGEISLYHHSIEDFEKCIRKIMKLKEVSLGNAAYQRDRQLAWNEEVKEYRVLIEEARQEIERLKKQIDSGDPADWSTWDPETRPFNIDQIIEGLRSAYYLKEDLDKRSIDYEGNQIRTPQDEDDQIMSDADPADPQKAGRDAKKVRSIPNIIKGAVHAVFFAQNRKGIQGSGVTMPQLEEELKPIGVKIAEIKQIKKEIERKDPRLVR